MAEEGFALYEASHLKFLEKRMAFPKRAYRSGEISIIEFSVAQGRLAEALIRYLDALLKSRADGEA